MLNIDIQNHKPLREIVYEELKKQILTGKIVPGTRLMEIELAQNLGVSRTPIREAIRKLEKEGLVTIEPRKGAYAAQLSRKDMIDILEVRQDMEGLAAAFAAERIDEKGKAQLIETAAEYKEALQSGDTERMIAIDTRFHRLIVEAAANKVLLNMVEQLQELVLRFRYIYYENFKQPEIMTAEHKEIIDAINAGDALLARKAASSHIEKLKNSVLAEEI